MSNAMEQKLKIIRLSERMTQKQLSDLTGLSLGTIKNYESGQNSVGLYVVQTILVQKPFRKYTMWVIHDKADDEEVQVAPHIDPTRKRAG